MIRRFLRAGRCILQGRQTYDPRTHGVVELGKLAHAANYDPTTHWVVPRGQEIYDPTTHCVVPRGQGIYDPTTHWIVPRGQGIYDPNVFGKYDLASQRVVPKSDAATGDAADLDIIAGATNAFLRKGTFKIEDDRYTLVLAALALCGPGKGICIDACTNSPLTTARERVTALGFEYMPVDYGGDGTNVRREDLTKLTFADGAVSRIISLDTLEHIDEYAKAVSELYRVLADGGVAIFHVPCYYFEKLASEPIKPGVDPWDHVRYFSSRELVRTIASAGFIVLRIGFHFDYGATLCVCTKDREFRSARAAPGD